MSQKIIARLKAEVDRLQHTDIPHTDEWWDGADYVRRRMKEVLSDLEKSEKPSDQDVNLAANNWICSHKDGEILYIKPAFIAGAQWQKEQMMKGAVEKKGVVCDDEFVKFDDGTFLDFRDPTLGIKPAFVLRKNGEKVKVIVIREGKK